MDVSTFYALFSATCFTLTGLWWGVVQRDTGWVRDPAQRRAVGGVYLAFLLPALMGLFAQVGGTQEQVVWRLGFIIIAAIGAVATLRLLAADDSAGITVMRATSAGVFALVAILGAFPELAEVLGLRAIQAEALLLILLVALGHGLAWRFLILFSIADEGPGT